MSLEEAKKRFKKFHLREPEKIIRLKSKIPQLVYPVGYCSQLSYHSNKWDKNRKWQSYIHWWENPTLVCVDRGFRDAFLDKHNWRVPMRPFDLGSNRRESTFLGHAIDFNLTEDDRTDIDVGPATTFLRERNPQSEGELRRTEDSQLFRFDSTPEESSDYVICSPSGNIVYVIADDDDLVFAFMNFRCQVRTEGITG